MAKALLSRTATMVGVRVPITVNGEVVYHWVGMDGMAIIGGTAYVKVSPTSDNNNAGRTNNSNWIVQNGSTYVRADSITGVATAVPSGEPAASPPSSMASSSSNDTTPSTSDTPADSEPEKTDDTPETDAYY